MLPQAEVALLQYYELGAAARYSFWAEALARPESNASFARLGPPQLLTKAVAEYHPLRPLFLQIAALLQQTNSLIR
ncbi:MAG: hypothetical protein EOO61_07570 [Hymenobacter sp.]|nr:MAG: hypothetical protein EOO61_07570 [Hymenobacter sp.]